jgi:ribosomal protein S2
LPSVENGVVEHLRRILRLSRHQQGGFLEQDQFSMLRLDPREEHIAVAEAKKMKIETIALLNSDCNKNEVTYPILANDSALKSVTFFLEALRDAHQAGVKTRA